MYNIDTRLESRIDRDRYIGHEFFNNDKLKFLVVGVWEHSPIGRAKRYVCRFDDGYETIAYAKNINKGSVKYIGKLLEDGKKDMLTALLVTDIHFCYQDDDALNILYQIVKEYKNEIDEMIDLGDGINNNALSRFIDISPQRSTLIDEINAYKNHLDILKSYIPSARFVILEDNHYHLRKERWLAENPHFIGLIPDLDDYFDEVVPHGIPYQPFDQTRFGLIHGVSYNKFFTKAHLEMYGMDIICGHTHTIQTYVSASGQSDMPPMRSYGVPCMSIRQNYLQGIPTRQVGGFAILTYDKRTTNYNIEYIIVENKRALFRGKIYEVK